MSTDIRVEQLAWLIQGNDPTWFKLDDDAFARLQQASIPQQVLARLEPLRGREIRDEKLFRRELVALLRSRGRGSLTRKMGHIRRLIVKEANNSQPLLAMDLAKEVVRIAGELETDRESLGRFAAYLLQLMPKSEADGAVGRGSLVRAVGTALAACRRADTGALATRAVDCLIVEGWCGQSTSGGLTISDATRLAARYLMGGVTLLDAALILNNDNDESEARRQVAAWSRRRRPYAELKKAQVGCCPNHAQRPLFKPAAICTFIDCLLGPSHAAQHNLAARLIALVRPPRQE